ncbi:hypothetical protein M0813_22289 [Anaeramoeba flamelloides]|uniref:Uncharacterized protein n=1 Tax=Anaeramoeba flamelloides TaxID=1746091 RepID=A0ABQ8YFG8_9EUKA|nr:hypothetical protein M0813_22289 [Anaeramoeba flamelloides]
MLSTLTPTLSQWNRNILFKIPKSFFQNLNIEQIDVPKSTPLNSSFIIDGNEKRQGETKSHFLNQNLCPYHLELGHEESINGSPKNALKEFKNALDFATNDQEKRKCFMSLISFFETHSDENKYSPSTIDLFFQARDFAFQNKELDLLISSSVLIYTLLSQNAKVQKNRITKSNLNNPLNIGIFDFAASFNQTEERKQSQRHNKKNKTQKEKELTMLLKGIEEQNSSIGKQQRSLFNYFDFTDFSKTVCDVGSLIKLSKAYNLCGDDQKALSVLLNSYLMVCIIDGSLSQSFLDEQSSESDRCFDFSGCDSELDLDLSDLNKLEVDLDLNNSDLDINLDVNNFIQLVYGDQPKRKDMKNSNKDGVRGIQNEFNGQETAPQLNIKINLNEESNNTILSNFMTVHDEDQKINYKFLDYFTDLKKNKKLHRTVKERLENCQLNNTQKSISDTIVLKMYTSEILFSLSQIFLKHEEYSALFFIVKEFLNKYEYQKAFDLIEEIMNRILNPENDLNKMLPFLSHNWPLLILELKLEAPLEFTKQLSRIETLIKRVL